MPRNSFQRLGDHVCLVCMAIDSSAAVQPPQPVWERLHAAVDFGNYRPCLRDGLAWREFITTRGEAYAIVQNPIAATYLRLTAEDFFIFRLMDGSRSVQQLVVAYMMEFHRIALQGIAKLINDLREKEMLRDRPYHAYQELERRTRDRTLGSSISSLLGNCLDREFQIPGIDAVAEHAYRRLFWPLFGRMGALLVAAVAVAGVPLLIWNLLQTRATLAPGLSFLTGLAFFAVSLLVITTLHEVGHALAVKSFGRKVLRGGFAITNGFPGLWVDTQDIWMEPRGARIAVSWAGPYSGFILAGVAGILVAVVPGGPWTPFVRLFGSAALVGNAIQLLPLVRLDGYYILMDWLDIPNLRARSLTFIRYDLWPKISRRQRLTREEWIFTIFGTSALIYSAVATLLIAWILWVRVPSVVRPLVQARSLQATLVAVFVIVLAMPFFAMAAVGLVGMARALARTVSRASGAARERWYRERANLLSQVPWMGRLGNDAILMLAAQLKEERRPAGTAIVRQGDPGDRFYLILDGRASVSIEVAGRSTVVAELGPMDYFGERALIERAPRAATVRAETSVRLLSLDARVFRTSLQSYVEADVALRSGIEELAEMDRFPLLQPLGPQERQVLLRYLRPISFAAGVEIVRQDQPSDAFYLLRSGRVAVTRHEPNGAVVELGNLEAGEFFGEIGLLTELPRVATVRALEETSVWSLDSRSFQNLLGQYFNLGERVMPVARARLSEDRLVAIAESDVTADLRPDMPAPELKLEILTGSYTSLAALRGRQVAVWFSRNRREPAADLARSIASARTAGWEFVRIVPDAAASGNPELPHPGYTILSDPQGVAFREYGMCRRLASDMLDDPWNNAMRLLSSEQSNRTDLLEIREGIALIGSDGRVDQLQPVDSDEELTRILAAVAGVTN